MTTVPETTPAVSVVMPVLNEALHLDETLASLLDQDVHPSLFEILLYDGGSDDSTLAIAESWRNRLPNLQVHRNPDRLPCHARNAGVRAARGSYIAFIEGHCVLQPSFVRTAIAVFERTGADSLGRPLTLWFSDGPVSARAIAMARHSLLGHDRHSLLYSDFEGFGDPISAATVYRRTVFDAIGLFDRTFYVAEDVDFNHRLKSGGLTHYFCQALRCGYRPRRTFGAFWRQMYSYGVGRARFVSKYDGAAAFRNALPVQVCLLILLSIAASMALREPWLLGPMLAYLAVSLLESVRMSLRFRDPVAAPLVPIAIGVVHFGMACGMVMEFRRGLTQRRARRVPG